MKQERINLEKIVAVFDEMLRSSIRSFGESVQMVGQEGMHAEPMRSVPWFGVRKFAKSLLLEVSQLAKDNASLRTMLDALGALSVVELEARRSELAREISEERARIFQERLDAQAELKKLRDEIEKAKTEIVETEEIAILQEVGVYSYRHPLTDVVAYEERLASIQAQVKNLAKTEGGAIQAATGWTVNGSEAQGRAMIRQYSKLMLRAFNAEADNLVRGLKPYSLTRAVERLHKAEAAIERLGKTMNIRISAEYSKLRVQELELTADYLHKLADQKESERVERERLREERRAQQEIERERAKLEKERQHTENALNVLIARGNEEGISRLQEQLADVDRAIKDMDYRAANIRAGYVYVISNVGSFGQDLVKIGMTRRLEPRDRIRELSDASVPFNFDVHALFFSKDAVGIEATMHGRLAEKRVNLVNQRREFFRAPLSEVKAQLAELAGELLEFQEFPEAIEYRQSVKLASDGYVQP
jgi:vacuolar-type H+-ATPase subunit I/STV1